MSAPAASTVPIVSVDSVLAAVKAALPAAQQAHGVSFAQAFYARLPQEELEIRPVGYWAGVALDWLAFAQNRAAGQARIRVFNPEAGAAFDNGHTVIEIIHDDMPFLVDSVSMVLAQHNIAMHVIVHPVIAISRDAAGNLTGVGEGAAESYMHLEVDRQASAEDLAKLQAAIAEALADVRASVADWKAMREKMLAIADDLGQRAMPASDQTRAEAQEFLRWTADNHFTFLGYREYEVSERDGRGLLCAVNGSGLGLMRGKDAQAMPHPLTGLAASDLPPGTKLDPLILTKTNARATVHRAGYMDYIGVLKFDGNGRAIAEQRFLGLYTSSAYSRRPWDIPLLRQRYAAVMAASGLGENSHSGKALRHILETLPRDEMFQSDTRELTHTCMGILSLQERVRTRLFLRRDRHGRFYSALVYIPRDRFSTEIRERIEALLMRELNGERLDTNIQIGESPLAQLHLIVRPKRGSSAYGDSAALESELAQIVRNWHDELRDQLVREHGDEHGNRLFNRFGRALPAGYIESVTPELAASDLLQAASLAGENDLRLSLYRSADEQLRFKLFRLGKEIALSDALPMLENLGVRINSEHPYELDLEDGRVVIQDFEVEQLSGKVDVASARVRFEQAFGAVWRGDAESDGFNRLVLAAGLDWRQVAVLRGYCKYLQQTGVTFSQVYMEETLARYPLIARLLIELFEARFEPGRDSKADPSTCEALRASLTAVVPVAEREKLATILEEMGADRGLDRDAQIDACLDALAIVLESVSSIDEDRILRGFKSVINATLRTSFFQSKGGAGQHTDYISFKFDPAKVPDLPKPRPYREIFVYSPFVEGVHLRFGPVARGGLRWSDRREDFRTEVLGLVKAQMVKNTVIVPVGSKGGFYCKQLPDPAQDRDAWFNEGVACYQRFINGLLDITDNLSPDGKVLPPVGVVRHDDDDPYLVVAADKGTATFSDTANAIAQAHGFWLDDAFASGGSVGYDHKGMGITARGAWESVKRHFRALGRDCQKEDFTVVGIGDMSGDVFGNGMLLSEHIRLVCAFDHRHIFLDPNPDPAVSFKERQRLFKLPRSSWDDYDKSLISKGGGVYPRSLKSIEISPQAREALGIDPAIQSMTPAELISAALRAPVDLLWNGGIGTYVKSASESNADIGDRANNGLRVNGGELRCKIVGEGGNLGMTQLGRIEAAHNGVLLNTDFIDNSAGVDTSDHEVNIKILLNDVVRAKKLTVEQRNKLLASMTDEVAGLVLMDNYRQNQAISLMERMSVKRLGSKQHFIRTLEQQGLLDRQIEFLPSDAELSARKVRGQGLTRPELAVLLSYSKIVAFQQLLESDIPEDPYLSKELLRYFPQPLQKKYADAMNGHRLKREIIATAVTNQTINRMGATFLLRMQEDTGRSPAEVAKAYTISREVLGARDLWTQIDALDGKLPEASQIDALQVIWSLQRSFVRWLLNRPGQMPSISDAVERYRDPFNDIREASGVLPDSQRPAYEAALREWRDKGMPPKLAQQLSELPYLEPAFDIIELARSRKLKPVDVSRVHFRLGDALGLPWLFEQIDGLAVDGRWHAVARGVMRDELAAHHRVLAGQAMSLPGHDADAKVRAWLDRDDPTLRFTLGMLAELSDQKSLDYPTLSVAVQKLGQLAARG